MSGYVPPHLRNAAGGASPSGAARGSVSAAPDAPSPYGGPRTSTGGSAYDRGSPFGRRSESTENLEAGGGGGSLGAARRVGSSGDLAASSSGYAPPGSSGARTSGTGFPEAVFATWTPPASLSSLSVEQVEAVRQRLNVLVEPAPGQSVPPGPVESFDDMVREEKLPTWRRGAAVAKQKAFPQQTPAAVLFPDSGAHASRTLSSSSSGAEQEHFVGHSLPRV